MTVPAALMPRLRRSLLGAWLAVAYALAVLAAGLSPQQAFAHQGFDTGPLCSGAAAPGEDAPAPAGEPIHCKGCPLGPVADAPPAQQHAIPARIAAPATAAAATTHETAPSPRRGLPPSRAPPARAA
jgi:hypothetical protein